MLRTMFSGVTGLRTHALKMDVIANDIANMNTVGFKKSDVSFKEQLVTTIRLPAPGTGGQQVGLGVQMGSIARNFSDGVLTETKRSSNIAIAGNGFMVVKNGAGANLYTRAGDFMHDINTTAADGSFYLMNPSGMRLQGIAGAAVIPVGGTAVAGMTDIIIPAGTVSYSISQVGTLNCYDAAGVVIPAGDWQIGLAQFPNPNGLKSEGSNVFSYTLAAGSAELAYQPDSDGAGGINQGYLENSNVDLAQEFTDMIVTQRGFQANSRSITTGDEMLQELLNLKR